jgi:hypothetical protein
MGDFLAGLRNVLGPILGQQPIAQARIGQTPIYQGAPGGSDLGSTFKNLTNSGSTITLRPDQDQSPVILKHEIIHSLVNKHGVDPSKIDFQDPPGQHFKDNVDPNERISYALAGPGNTPEIKAAMEKAILASKDVPQGFKNDLQRMGVMSQPQPVLGPYDTKLSPPEETKFQSWKQKNAPNDSGADYDLRGAYKAGLSPAASNGHWSDLYKKPNHPTFSNESMYATPDAPHWEGSRLIGKNGNLVADETPTTQVSAPNPPQYNPNLPGGPTPQDQPTNYHDAMGNPIHLDTGGSITAPTSYHDAQGNPIHLDQNGQIMDSRIIQRPPDTQASTEPAAPFYGRAVAGALPMIGSTIEPGLGTAAGYSIAQLMKGASPSTFGQPDQNIADFAKGLGVNLLTQDVAPGVLGWGAKKIASALPAVKEGTANLLSKNLAAKFGGKTESGLLEKAAGEAADTHAGLGQVFNPKTAQVTPNPSTAATEAAFGKNQVGQQLLNLKNDVTAGGDVAKAQQYHTISDQMYSDLTHVRNAKLVADPGTVAEIGYHKLLGGSEGPIDAKGILTELGGKKSEIYQEGLGENLPAFKDALGQIAQQQKTGPGGSLLSYASHHLVWTGVATGGVGLISHPAAAVAGGAVLTNSMFSKLMSSEYAPVVVAALKTPAGSPQAAVINQFMSAAIKSVGALATTPDK